MCKKRKDELIRVHAHVHPPFPSFAWVMTAQANPPAQAYAYGYIRNAQALHPRPLAHRVTPPGCHRPYARSSRSPPSPARSKIEPCDEKFMKTVDYRHHDDPPLRPYVPWLEGYTLRGREAQQLRHQQQLKQGLLPPGLTIAAPAITQTPPAVTTTVSKCGFSGDYDDVRPKKRVIVDVVKLKRLDIALNALRRACGLSGKEPSKSSIY